MCTLLFMRVETFYLPARHISPSKLLWGRFQKDRVGGADPPPCGMLAAPTPRLRSGSLSVVEGSGKSRGEVKQRRVCEKPKPRL